MGAKSCDRGEGSVKGSRDFSQLQLEADKCALGCDNVIYNNCMSGLCPCCFWHRASKTVAIS